MTASPPSRRQMLAGAVTAAFTSGCGRQRANRSLTYVVRGEPTSFDPAKSLGGGEALMFSALFEPLLEPHPETMEPMAGLATHYKVNEAGTEYTFYLRGHAAPEGVKLAGRESLTPVLAKLGR